MKSFCKLMDFELNANIRRRTAMRIFLFPMLIVKLVTLPCPAAALPTLAEAITAKEDVWGDAAMHEPNGPSYEFFAKLLPPLHYVNADFKHYPIVLSAPNAQKKARLISNGSGINLRANTRSWKELGVP